MSVLSPADKDAIREAYTAITDARGLTPRWGQRQMIAEVANTLALLAPAIDGPDSAGSPIAVIEAGTGTGKTIAYVIPALVMARVLNKRLIIATATVALQEQLVHKDLPDIKAGSGLDFSYVLAKGRRRYLCLSQLDRLMARESGGGQTMGLYPDEVAPTLARDALESYGLMLDALGRGDWDGDRDNWSAPIDDVDWLPVTADQGQCSGRRCPNIRNCSFYRARDGLQEADVVVTNHDLVLSDLALGGGAILPAPEDSIYIFDEGHHLPDKALNHFASFCRLPSTLSWLGDSRKALAKGAPLLTALPGLSAVLEPMSALFDDLQLRVQQIGEQAAVLMAGAGDFEEQLRFAGGIVPADLQQAATAIASQWSRLNGRLMTLEAGLDDALEDEGFASQRDELEAWQMAVGGMLVRAEGVLSLFKDFAADASEESPPRARWLRRRPDDEEMAIDFHCSHILAADILREQLWERAAGVVLTSATMTALGSFDRFRARSGVPEDGRYKIVVSPFDYSRATLHVPAMESEPSNAPAHTEELITQLPQLLDAREGSLVLFSSRRQMNDVYDGLPREWRDRILRQDDFSKQEIIRRHRETIDAGDGAVIFGLASFAEGVDLPGNYCQHVVIAKLPFAVPDNPVDAALAEWLEAQGRNAFMEISVPDAALKLVQASGRLLRTETDTGRVTLMDRRVLTRRYGRAILDSLPPFQRRIG
ncbi:ATP-dependent DNA helicase DinG [Congregibacter variabilis]|uniref:ATP-dependent DNA helicase DinG n=1 Tax=Congregibacter variabilis TaxID=3081200 RepID=A0ABZ0HYJ7_9GAMM|nr:ATP-dependent DNA helicase DinG [Congregibacter sp. IMCC43200]